MKKFCVALREHAKNIIDFEKKKNIIVNKRRIKSHQEANKCYICRKIILRKYLKV